jgi:four helix bundle protein
MVLRVYDITKSFPAEERFGLSAQMRRCAVSIPSNIAEGFGRHGLSDYLRFMDIALGSTYELQTQLRLAKDLNLIQDSTIPNDIAECERILNGLIRSLRNKPS